MKYKLSKNEIRSSTMKLKEKEITLSEYFKYLTSIFQSSRGINASI